MRQTKKRTAILLAVCMAIPNVGGLTLNVKAAQTANIDVTVEAGYSSNHIYWSDMDAAKYRILRSVAEDGEFAAVTSEDITDADSANGYDYVDASVEKGIKYYYKVEAYDTDSSVAAQSEAVADVAVGMDGFREHAALAKKYTGEDQIFDGTRVEDVSGTADAVHGVNTGTIIMKFKATPNIDTNEVILCTKMADADLDWNTTNNNVTTVGQNATVLYLKKNNNNLFRFGYHHTQAEYRGPNYADGSWHCIVLSSNTTGKYMRLTIDGQEYWSNTVLSNQGLFARQTTLDQVTIGGMLAADGTVTNAFKGSIAEIIVTSEELTDAEAIEVSRSNALGGAISEMFNTSPDNSWVFTGGAAVQGGFDQTRGARNYIGQFEEYVRWTKSGTENGRQRYTINTGKSGRTLADVVADYDNLVKKYEPKAAAYMVGKEDYSAGDDGLSAFKQNLRAFIDKSLALKANNQGFAVIQKPFAVKDADTNAMIEKYCTAVDEVAGEYESDASKATRIVVADHYTQTNTDTFKTDCLQDDGTLNQKGHMEIGKEFAAATIKSTDNFPGTTNGMPNLGLTEAEQPEEYLDVIPAVASGETELRVTVPAGNGDAWKYQVDMEGMLVEGTADSNTFTIPGLINDKNYVLKIQSADGKKQLTTMKGVIAEGNIAEVNKQVLTEVQRKLVSMTESDEPMTWLFMGDSITHAALWTAGYDGIAQSFEKYVKDELGRTDDVVINTAVSGATTASTLADASAGTNAIYNRLEKYTPDVVSIMLGTNDLATSGLTADVYKNNLETLVSKIRTLNPDAVIIFRTPAATWTGREASIPAYNKKMKEVADATENSIYIEQFTEMQAAIGNYTWLKEARRAMFGNNLHPGANGHLIMTRDFIRACGLWTEDSPITNLFYDMNIEEVTSTVVPELQYGVDQIGISIDTLKTGSTLQIGDVTIKATDKTNNQSYSVSAGIGEKYATLKSLPRSRSYDVVVSAYLKNEAKEITFASQTITLNDSQTIDFDLLLGNTRAKDLSEGAVVGSLSVGATAPEGEYTYAFCSGEGDTDNAKFTISGVELKIAEALTEKETYSIRIKASNGSAEKESIFEIYAVGRGLIFTKEDQTITSGSPVDLTNEPYAEQLFDMEEGTVIVRYTLSSDDSIQSLFSIANGTANNQNRHFHVFVNNGISLGFEIRNPNDGFSYTKSVNNVVKGYPTVNTIAFKADKEEGTYKLFANGKLVLTVDADSLGGYKFVSDITGVDSAHLGATKRANAANGFGYPFGGTINNISVYETALSDEELIQVTSETGQEELQQIFHTEDGLGCNYYRIPSILTLTSGTVISAIDARFGGTHDSPNNIDIAVSRSADGGETWSAPALAFHYDDYADNTLDIPVGTGVRVNASASFIDPVLLQDEETGRVFLISDAMAAGYGSPQAVTGSGYKEIDGKKYLKLKKSGESDYNYTVRENNVIWNDTTNTATEYSLNTNFEVLKNGQLQTVKQKSATWDPTSVSGALMTETTNKDVAMNIMYADSIFTALPTTWLYMKYSDDDGETWSAPILLNGMVKPEDSRILITGPGRGMQIKNGEHRGRLIIPVYDASKAGIIYSDDHGTTWTYAPGANTSQAAMSESQIVELPDGTLRVYGRSNNSKVSTAVSLDGGETWSNAEYVDGLKQPGWGSQLSVINYSALIDGKPAILMSGPDGVGSYRKDGHVRIGLITDTGEEGIGKYSIEWKYDYSIDSRNVQFGYSCLTELPNHSIGIIYEKYDSYNPAELHTKNAIKYEELSLSDLKAGNQTGEDGELSKIDQSIPKKNATAYSQQKPASGNDGPAEWAFDDEEHWWHSRWQGTPAEGEAESGLITENAIWLQTGFDGVQYVKKITYLPRQDEAFGRINEYEIQVANLEDPAAVPQDGDFAVVKSGGLENIGEEQTIMLDKLTPATHIRILVKSVYANGGTAHVAAQRIQFFGNVVDSLKLTAPAKTEYTQGEDLDTTGIAVKAVYTDKSEADVTEDVTVIGFDGTTAGRQTVTVSYAGKTATFEVTVKEAASIVDTSALEAEIAKAEALKLDDYKDGAEKDAFVKALADAKTAKDQAESQAAVDAAKAALADAAAKLVPAETEPDKKPVESISIHADADSIIIKEEKELTATVNPADADDADKVEWSSSNEEVLTVDANGKIRAMWPGEAVITAKAGGKSAETKITVYGVEKIYKDVKDNDWFYSATNWAYVNDVMGGYGNGSFGPNDSLARAQFAVIMYRIAGLPEVEFEDRFPDVKADDWFADAVIWANDNGIITGYTDSGSFGPADKITREQIAAILYRYAKAEGYDVNASANLGDYPDADKVNGFAQDAMKWAVGKELIKGDNGKLNPQGNANRAEAATIIWRFCEAYAE